MSDEPLKFMASIKAGAAVSHDFGFFKWPRCKNMPADPHMIFEATERSYGIDLVAPGYGAKNDYGNGSIDVGSIADLVVDDHDLQRVVDKQRRKKLAQIQDATQTLEKLCAELSALPSPPAAGGQP